MGVYLYPNNTETELKNAYIWIPDPTSIVLNKSSISLTTVWQTVQLTATIEPTVSDKTITWSSDDTTVATVSTTGLVTCVTPWECTITATTVNNLTATCGVWAWWQPWVNTVAYYPLDTDFNDHSWNWYNLTQNSTQLTTIGWVQCLDLNNSFCLNNSLVVTSLPLTIAFYAKAKASWGLKSCAIERQYSGSWGWSWVALWAGFYGANYIEVRYGNTTNQRDWISHNIDTNWHFYCITYDTSWCYVYIDGQATYHPKSSLINQMANTYPFRIGMDYEWVEHWNGYVWEIIIESKTRTAQEVADYYNLTKSLYGIS